MAKGKRPTENVTFWQMVRDVLIASMNKGQFPFAAFAVIIITMIIKMPSEDVSKFAFKLASIFELHQIMGYILAGVLLIGWFIHSKFQRRIITVEMARIANQRDKLQADKLGENLVESSE